MKNRQSNSLSRPVSRAAPGAAAPAMERLETRQLFDAQIIGNVLYVTGTANNDSVFLSYEPNADFGFNIDVTNSSSPGAAPGTTSFDANSVTKVVVNLGQGDDSFGAFLDNGTAPLPLEIHGGQGNDTIAGSLGNDTIFGGTGDDQITDGLGNNEIHGATGNDVLTGGAANDTIFGGVGNDQIDGGGGNNELHGGTGDDSLTAGDGDDALMGGQGNDSLNAGIGSNVLVGGVGADHFSVGQFDTVLDFDSNTGDLLV